MNKNQVKASPSDEKGKAKVVADKAADSKSMENKDRAEKEGKGGKGGAVLADVNGDAKRNKK